MASRFLTAFILLSSLVLGGCWKQPRKFTWENAPGAEQYERLMWQSVRSKQWLDVEHHLAPMFVGAGADGRKFDAAGWVEYWKGLQISDFSMDDVTVAPNGVDMVVTYDLHLTGTSIPSPNLRVISVWQQLKNGWVLISHSETPIRSTQQSAISIQSAQQVVVVSTYILPSKVAGGFPGCEPAATVRLL
jgi:hypothetical protein